MFRVRSRTHLHLYTGRSFAGLRVRCAPIRGVRFDVFLFPQFVASELQDAVLCFSNFFYVGDELAVFVCAVAVAALVVFVFAASLVDRGGDDVLQLCGFTFLYDEEDYLVFLDISTQVSRTLPGLDRV